MTEHVKLLDSVNRSITYLRVSVTDRCNLRCVYCMPQEGIPLLGHSEVLTFEEIMRVIDAAVELGVTKVRITGGEPLVRKDIVSLVQSVVSKPGIRDVGLTTNAIRLIDFVDPLWDAGLRRINISLDTLIPDKFKRITRVGDIESVLAGVEKALARGYNPVKINVVAFRGFNDDEIQSFGKMAIDKPIHVRFIERMPMEHTDLGPFLPEQEIMRRLKKVGELEEIERSEVGETARRFKYKGGVGEIGLISPMTNKFCAGCNRLRLNADGTLQSCLLGDAFTDLKKPLREGASVERIKDLIREAAWKKQDEHKLDVTGVRKCARAMPIVGG